MLFSGPIQPPMLGAAVGSARLHLEPDFSVLQAELQQRLSLGLAAIERVGLELSTPARSPIFQAQCDSPRVAFTVAQRMRERGFYCCICVFPAVPMNRPGIRFTVTRHNEPADIEQFMAKLAECLAEVAHEQRHASQEPVTFAQ
jgi:7-keto-8-aminopelargonate synthetase-like enzyme